MTQLKNIYSYLHQAQQPHAPHKRTVMRYLLEKIAYLKEVDLLWRQQIDAALKPHTKVLDYQHPILFVATQNSVFNTQLRYRTPVILKKLQAAFGMEMLEEIQYLVRPEFFEATTPTVSTEKLHLSKEHAEMILHTAQSVTHRPLRDALMRLGTYTH